MSSVSAPSGVVVFEHLQRWHAPLLRWYLGRGYAAYYLFPTAPDPDLGPVYALQRSGRIAPLRVPDYPYVNISPIANRAFDATERLYPRLEATLPLIAGFERLYQSSDVRLAFRKQLLFELTEYFHCRALREQLPSVLPPGTQVTFVPIRAAHALLSRQFDDHLDASPDGDRAWRSISFPLWVKLQALRSDLVARLRIMALVGYSIGMALRGAWRRRPVSVQSFDLAVAIVSPLREFANEVRGVDFLLDHKRVRKDNTLFVPVVPLPPQRLADMRAKGLLVAEPAGPLLWGEAMAAVREGVRTLLHNAGPTWVARTAAHLLREHWIWSGFAHRYRVGQFVTYADFSVRQIGRNILLNRHGTQTWYYLDTENLGALNFHNPAPGTRRHHFWGYLYYNHFVAWSQRVAEYHRAHYQRIGRYYAVGCIWAEHVLMLRERRDELPLRHRLVGVGWTRAHRVVVVFDSSYNDFSRTTYQDGVQFARAIQGLLEAFPDIYIVWKEKKPRWVHSRVPAIRSGGLGPAELLQMYEELDAHPRCYFAGYDASASEALAVADLTISFPFTSSTVEALGARSRAIFYAPNERYYGSYFESIPDLIARRPQELRRLTQKWLYDASDEEFARYLNAQLLGRIDPYLDAGGLSRFRHLLLSSNADQLVPDETAAGQQLPALLDPGGSGRSARGGPRRQ